MLCATCQQPRKLTTGGLCSTCYAVARYGPNWRERYKRHGECKKCKKVKRLVNARGECLKCRFVAQHGKTAWKKQRSAAQRRLHKRRRPAAQACNICGKVGKVEQDHSHDLPCGHGTGLKQCALCQRGVLCGKCNRAIGLLQDSPYITEAATKYLLFWREKQGR